MYEDNDDVLDVRIVAQPTNSSTVIRDQVVLLIIGSAITTIGAMMTDYLVDRARERRKAKRAQELEEARKQAESEAK